MQKELKLTDYYSTFDLGLSTALSLFYPVELIQRVHDGGKAEFFFRREEGLDNLVTAYFRNELQVSPQIYWGQLRVIKSRLYSNENSSLFSAGDGKSRLSGGESGGNIKRNISNEAKPGGMAIQGEKVTKVATKT